MPSVCVGGTADKEAGAAAGAVTVTATVTTAPVASDTVMLLVPSATKPTLSTDPLSEAVAIEGLDDNTVYGVTPPETLTAPLVPARPVKLAGLTASA